MNDFNKYLTVTALILAFIGLASASAAELTIFPEESSTKIDSFTSYQVEVENVGPVEDVYEMSSNSPEEITIAPTRVPEEGNLEPGETKTVNVWYNPRETASEGRESFEITATSRASGERYTTTGHVNIIKDHQVSLNSAETSRTVCLDEDATYEIEVGNDGTQKDEYQLETEFGELSDERIELYPDETRTVTVTGSSEEEATENFNVRASSRTASYDTESIGLEFEAETCWDSEISMTPEQQDVAAFTEAEYEVTVRNTGTRTDEFVLSASEGELEESVLEIPGGDSATTGLTVTPEELGTKDVEVTAESNVESTGTAEMDVYNGMDLDIRFPGDTTACEKEIAEAEVTIENTGEAEETYNLEESEGELSESEVTLSPDEEETVELVIDTEDYDLGEHELEVTGTAASFGEPVETATTELEVENCWDLELNVVPEVASAGENRSTVYRIDIENPGTRTNTYEITHNGPEWLSITPREQEVAPGQQEISYMYAGVPFEKKGELEITVTGTGTDIQKSTTAKLLMDKDLEEAIEDDSERATGRFTQRAGDLVDSVTSLEGLGRIGLAIVVGLGITALIIYREW